MRRKESETKKQKRVISIEANERIASLVTEIQNGNDKAFDELYKLTNQRAYFVALEFVKKDEDAQDILQESYIKALSKIKELGKPESFQSWLNQIVANKSKDFLKKKKPTLFEAEENEVFEVLPDEDLDFRPESSLDQNELQRTVMEVLDELNEEKKACVLMMYFEELSVGEIAETLEIPEGTVKTRLFSARKDLKEKFAKRGITSAYSVAPIGVVLWAWRRTSVTTGTAFAASAGSASVLAGITASGAVTAAGTAATVAGTAAVSAGAVTAGTAVATGTGFVAKIAALTVVQKVIAGVSVAAVVAGSTAGVVTVVKHNEKKEEATTTAYIEEITTAPHEETTIAVQSAGSVIGYTMTDVYGNVTAVTVQVNGQNGNTAPIQGEAATSGEETASEGTTARQPTTRANSTTTTRPSSTRPNSTTTTRPSSTRPNSTSTTRPSSTRPPQTNPPQTNPPETQPSTTKGTATVKVAVYTDAGEPITDFTYSVEEGSLISKNDVKNEVVARASRYNNYNDYYSGDSSCISIEEGTEVSSAQAGKEYSFIVTVW